MTPTKKVTVRSASTCLLISWALLLGACGPVDDMPPPPMGSESEDPDEHTDDDVARPRRSCPEGDMDECTITFTSTAGVTVCRDGVRFCVDQRWTECFPDDAPVASDG